MKRLLPLLILALLLGACVPPAATPAAPATDLSVPDPAPQAIDLPVGSGLRTGSFELYFTDPYDPAASTDSGGPDTVLSQAIDEARLSVDVAIYSMSLPSIRDALINAHRRGVAVRVVIESDNRDRSAPQALIDAGISVLGDRREGLMHDKFVIIDRAEVWTGSMNVTMDGAYEDHNHLLRIRSTRMAENYTREFEEMFVDDLFGPDRRADTPYPTLTLNGTPVETYFSPDDKVADHILPLIQNAQQSIYFLAFSFTSDDLAAAIMERANAGVTVAGVMEAEQVASNIGTEYDPFRQAGLNVHLDGNPGQMHHKVMIIDGEILILGSYNFTRSAEERNDENLLVIFNADLAGAFIQEFNRIFANAQP